MGSLAFNPKFSDMGFAVPEDVEAPLGSAWLAPADEVDLTFALSAQLEADVAPGDDAPVAPGDDVPDLPLFASDFQVFGPRGAALETTEGGRTTSDGIELAQILRDRPDVFNAFFTEFYGPNNDHHSSAWMNRVGGKTPEDYANYWYETRGRYEGYQPGLRASILGGHGESDTGPGYVTGGRTTADGIELAKILYDRPDVFRAFFTEYYGPNNDLHSTAWMNRVGGVTPEDYANYWYETYGKYGAYTPSSPLQAPSETSEDDPAGEDGGAAPGESDGAAGGSFAWDGSPLGAAEDAADDPVTAAAPAADGGAEAHFEDWAVTPEIVIIPVGHTLTDPLPI